MYLSSFAWEFSQTQDWQGYLSAEGTNLKGWFTQKMKNLSYLCFVPDDFSPSTESPLHTSEKPTLQCLFLCELTLNILNCFSNKTKLNRMMALFFCGKCILQHRQQNWTDSTRLTTLLPIVELPKAERLTSHFIDLNWLELHNHTIVF